MDRSDIKSLPQPIKAATYYVEDECGRWGFFTITPEIGLVQVHSDYGCFAHRYDAFHGDFREFLTTAEGIRDKFESWWYGHNPGVSANARRHMWQNLKTIMVHLWPLFIAHLKAEMENEQASVPVVRGGVRVW